MGGGSEEKGIEEREPRGGVVSIKHPTMSFCTGGHMKY